MNTNTLLPAAGCAAPSQSPTRHSPLHAALDAWAGRDDFGGFMAAGAMLFPGWTAKRACRAPHREDRNPSFGLYTTRTGAWRFKDHGTGEQGGLVDFVMLAGMDRSAAARWLMEQTFTAEAQRRGGREEKAFNNSPSPRLCASAVQFQPYAMSDVELRRCAAMAEALAGDPAAIARMARARGWKPETIRNLALDPCLGLRNGRPVMIYPTGAKERLKPLDEALAKDFSGCKFLWMFGKPDSLWRGDRLLQCTRRVHITEGETAAISLIDDGYEHDMTEVVMAVPGASSWRDEWAEQFRGLDITLWPDGDAAGMRLYDRIIASLRPFAKSIDTIKTMEND